MTKQIVHVIDPKAEELPLEDDPGSPKVGRWYWVKNDPDSNEGSQEEESSRWMGCVIHIGSNYVEIQKVTSGRCKTTIRVHFDNFWNTCELVYDPDSIIRGHVQRCQTNVRLLMAEVHDITARLSITPGQSLTDGSSSETSALALRNDQSVEAYKAELVLAKDKTLPELFEKIRDANSETSMWMGAQLIPMEAQAESLQPAIGAIKRRIFSVQLYAGLTEEVVQIQDGKPAEVTEKIRLFQRRAYMDEECLAEYEVGGMDYKGISDFDRWISKPSNRDRLLPFPRTILAFRVRRHMRDLDENDFASFRDFFSALDRQKYDKITFLYIRNGDQLYRLETSIEFGADLFPDMDHDELEGGQIWACLKSNEVRNLISDTTYQGMLERRRQKKQKRQEAQKKGEYLATDSEEFDQYFSEYHPFSPTDVFYDDIARFIKDQTDKHNRLVLVLQGLLDRSTILHPHPPWRLWDPGGFKQALEPIYDASRTLPETETPPDFEEYRAKCNASLRVGSVTIGQEIAWERAEAHKENERGHSRRTIYRHRPYGNPGPGSFAYVAKFSKKKATCSYEWGRKRQTLSREGEDKPELIRCSIEVSAKVLFNVSAYRPGDFRQFFKDPRTRENYLKWAPMLIEAEEFHAGNREVAPLQKLPPRKRTTVGSREYYRRKKQKALIGKAVRLTRDINMRNGTLYKSDTLWRVIGNRGKEFHIRGILPNGQEDPDYRAISNLEEWFFEVDFMIPAPPSRSPVKKEEDEGDDKGEEDGDNDDGEDDDDP